MRANPDISRLTDSAGVDAARRWRTTYADATALERDFGFSPHPRIILREGLRKFARCYKGYYGV